MVASISIGLNPNSTRVDSESPLPRHAKAVDITTSIIGKSMSEEALGYQKNSQTAQTPTTPLQDAVATVDNYFYASGQLLTYLTKCLDRGDLYTAGLYLNQYMSTLTLDNSEGEDPTVAADPFLSKLAGLGDAVQKGDLSAAKSALSDAESNSPGAAAAQLSRDTQTSEFDALNAVWDMQHGLGLPVKQLDQDIFTIDKDLRTESVLIQDGLAVEGDSKSRAHNFAQQITGIPNGTAADNAAEDQTRADKWVQGVIDLANGTGSLPGFSNVQKPTDTTITLTSIDSLLGTTLMGSLDAWNQLKELVQYTLDPNGSSGIKANSDSLASLSGSIQLLA